MTVEFELWARDATPRLLRAAYLLTGNQHTAEDLVQIALERTAMSWRRIATSPDSYARQTLYRSHVSTWRRKRIREVLHASPPEAADRDDSSTTDLRVTLQGALLRLSTGQRAVLVLRFYADLSEVDAAAVLGCSVGTVKSQTHKAMAALRRTSPELANLVGGRQPSDA